MSTRKEQPAPRRSNKFSWFLSLLIAISALPVSAEEPGELLLVALRVDQEILIDAMGAYGRDGGMLLPLGEICRALRIGVTVDAAHGTAEGFFGNETRRFRLDAGAGEVTIGGAAHAVPPRKVALTDDEIYVDGALLGSWFPFDVRIDLFGAMVLLLPREKLPFQVQRERERAIEQALAGLRAPGETPPFVRNPYAIVTRPFVDQQLRFHHVGGKAAMQYATLATGDLLGAEASFFLSGGNEKPFDLARGTLGRSDPNAQLLGPLHAREIAGGDVLLPGNDLVTTTVRGNGVLLSNFPLQRLTDFSGQTLTGELPPGWDVELYLNGALIAFQKRDDGRYEFRDVPVLYGFNVFRLVFHGPHGELRQQIRTHHIGDTLTPPGTLQYRVGSAAPDVEAPRSMAELSCGVTSRLSVAALAARLGDEQFATAGVRSSMGRFFTYADIGGSSRGGRIVRAGVQSRIGGVAMGLTRAELSGGYTSETFRPILDTIASRTTLRLGGMIHRVPVTFDAQRDTLTHGGDITRLGTLVSTVLRRTWISNRVDALFVKGIDSPLVGKDNVTGTLLVSRSVRGLILRGEHGYELRPQRRLTTMSVLAELPRVRGTQVSAQVSRSIGTRIIRTIARLRRERGPAGITLAVEVPSRGKPSVHIELSTSLIPNPITRRIAFRARPAAANGAVTARVFLDRNANGIRDQDEPPVERAGFFVNRNSVEPQTNAGGVAMLGELPAHAATDVRLSTSTLEDPWWVPSRPAVRVVPRPGKAQVVDFPVTVAGEITGTVLRGARPAGRVRLQIVGANGEVVREATSEYDGFYDLTRVPLGTFTLRIHPEDVAAMRLANDAARTVVITADRNVLDGVDLVLSANTP
jgi:hypothetical protein